MHARPACRIGRQRFADHVGPQIRATDADVDHIGYRLAGRPQPLTGADFLAHRPHACTRVENGGHDVLAVHSEYAARIPAQRHVQHGALLGGIDALTGKQAGNLILQSHLCRECKQERKGFLRGPVLGVVHPQRANPSPPALAASRVLDAQAAQMAIGQAGVMGLERFPGRQLVKGSHGSFLQRSGFDGDSGRGLHSLRVRTKKSPRIACRMPGLQESKVKPIKRWRAEPGWCCGYGSRNCARPDRPAWACGGRPRGRPSPRKRR